jgi:hypothetical protein
MLRPTTILNCEETREFLGEIWDSHGHENVDRDFFSVVAVWYFNWLPAFRNIVSSSSYFIPKMEAISFSVTF